MPMSRLRERPWYANQAGTRYIRDKAKPKSTKEKPQEPVKALLPLLQGEAQGDVHLAVIMAIRNLLSEPEHYVKLMRACSKTGQSCEPTTSDAVRWSIFGALEFITYPNFTRAQKRVIIDRIKPHLPGEFRASLSKWEEDPHTKHSHVIRVLNAAIGEYQMTEGGPTFTR